MLENVSPTITIKQQKINLLNIAAWILSNNRVFSKTGKYCMSKARNTLEERKEIKIPIIKMSEEMSNSKYEFLTPLDSSEEISSDEYESLTSLDPWDEYAYLNDKFSLLINEIVEFETRFDIETYAHGISKPLLKEIFAYSVLKRNSKSKELYKSLSDPSLLERFHEAMHLSSDFDSDYLLDVFIYF